MAHVSGGAPRRSLVLSAGLHLLVAGLLLVTFAPEVKLTGAPPMSVELIAGGGDGKPGGARPAPVAPAEPAPPAPEAAPVPQAAPTPAVPAPPPPAPPLADAKVKLADAKAPAPAKPQPAPPEPPAKRPPAKAEAAKSEPKGTPAKASPGKAPPAKGGNIADDLLSDLGGPAGPGAGSVSQKGGKQGVVGGSPNGRAGADAGYLDRVRGRIRPYVVVPPGLSGNPEAVLKVTLLPTLEVRQVKLIKSSGSAAYDDAVQAAVWQARSFPPLPAGASFADYREYTLRFRPRD
ncbi:cell envelope integrity protein TolA [Crenobacter caeni]|uniref:TonB C-terminal domain-containing protein n=1 Tax=Crenobacter caeni TaxID=2705474 RepID=A0A6B2KMQ5_9NEIS|nr:cell envelope integrity protein TolA [Crenobacter caeni]NDV11413.1 TonB C-terminal domain-containing protein [Crenobacter caeni]